jgi:L-alanine-DL-glutamate epimerase-like enolase superfamily enzyme
MIAIRMCGGRRLRYQQEIVMRITEIKRTPLFIPFSQPFHWAQGVSHGAYVILVEVHTDAGEVGFGECIASPSPEAIEAYLQQVARLFIGRDPFENAQLISDARIAIFKALGTGSAPRFSGQILAGLEMALWDVMGKITKRAAHELLGGAVRDEICYFGFAHGQSAADVAADAVRLVEDGFEVIYFKAGRGDAFDLETAAKIREAIGPQKRLRVDPNEHWTAVHASRMIRKLAAFDIEVIEQPTHCESVTALAQIRINSPIAISADQSVFTPFDAYDVCRQQAADLIVIGLHETGGLCGLSKVAHIAEAAGIDVCIHGVFETGITTCASNQVAGTISNLDDGNQHMTRFLAWDLVKSPDLSPRNGRLPVLKRPGLGFEIDWNSVERARRAYADVGLRHLQ